ncbi:MAG: hypothetical protein Q9N68_10450 [Gammaproteobacteria bacterium]|nr:hypothetical protein [Gammaproteobacteria bacterium]
MTSKIRVNPVLSRLTNEKLDELNAGFGGTKSRLVLNLDRDLRLMEEKKEVDLKIAYAIDQLSGLPVTMPKIDRIARLIAIKNPELESIELHCLAAKERLRQLERLLAKY